MPKTQMDSWSAKVALLPFSFTMEAVLVSALQELMMGFCNVNPVPKAVLRAFQFNIVRNARTAMSDTAVVRA